MDCFFAKVREGGLVLKEAEAARWLTKSELYEVQWLPADLSLIAMIEKKMTAVNSVEKGKGSNLKYNEMME